MNDNEGRGLNSIDLGKKFFTLEIYNNKNFWIGL